MALSVANKNFSVPYAYLAAAYAYLGEADAAASAMRRLLEAEPGFTGDRFAQADRYPPALLQRLVAVLAQVETALQSHGGRPRGDRKDLNRRYQ